MAPPAVYLQEVPEPRFVGQNNRHLLAWALELREALRLANSDKAALRDWSEGYNHLSERSDDQ